MTQTLTALSLQPRQGPRPATSPSVPHRQLDQLPDAATLQLFIDALIANPEIAVGKPHSSMDDGRSLKEAGGGMFRQEFGHVHDATDGSLHLRLSAADIRYVTDMGWGEPHPTFSPAALIYAPRNQGEIDTVLGIVHHSRSTYRR